MRVHAFCGHCLLGQFGNRLSHAPNVRPCTYTHNLNQIRNAPNNFLMRIFSKMQMETNQASNTLQTVTRQTINCASHRIDILQCKSNSKYSHTSGIVRYAVTHSFGGINHHYKWMDQRTGLGRAEATLGALCKSFVCYSTKQKHC